MELTKTFHVVISFTLCTKCTKHCSPHMSVVMLLSANQLYIQSYKSITHNYLKYIILSNDNIQLCDRLIFIIILKCTTLKIYYGTVYFVLVVGVWCILPFSRLLIVTKTILCDCIVLSSLVEMYPTVFRGKSYLI